MTMRKAGDPPRQADLVRHPLGAGRETVESIVVAFVLALLFRSFEAEAFVIPTGSMAPTLMGRHRDLVCDTCGDDFRVGCSKELDEATCRLDPRSFVRQVRCPTCGATTRLTDASGTYRHAYPAFTGDRIIVEKVAYDFVEPSRWDVVVFKYPEDARINYIKRLVGLPGETLSIAGGDLWTSRDDEPPRIARKPPATMRSMLQCVHDSRHEPQPLQAAGWPAGWSDWSGEGEQPRWVAADGGQSFSIAVVAGAATLRWRHFVPDGWEGPESRLPKVEPALVGDFQPYNQSPEYVALYRDARHNALVDGGHWVGDLAVELDLESRAATGRLVVDLVEAGERHTCSFDLATGEAVLAIASRQDTPAVAVPTRVRGRGRWRVVFANVDDELSLFVDGRRATTAQPTVWTRPMEAAADTRPVVRGGRPGDSQPDDLAPVGITADAAEVTVSNLRVLRDIYYIASGTQAALLGREREEAAVSYPLAADQFFMLGDNSSASKDSRAWGTPEEPIHHVDRRLLTGRALVVFWPHAVPAPWNVKVAERCGWELRLPCLPNFGRMRFVK
ncbi:MAG: signal peptidase I [Planctomycetes bacterium]|nr:signal peptidase I [Planctomycetota bacterium]